MPEPSEFKLKFEISTKGGTRLSACRGAIALLVLFGSIASLVYVLFLSITEQWCGRNTIASCSQ